MNRFVSISNCLLTPTSGVLQTAIDESGRAWERERNWQSSGWTWSSWSEVERLPEMQSPKPSAASQFPVRI